MFCKNCGSKLEDGARFCSGCGCSISDTDAPISSKTAHDRRKIGIVIAMGIAVILCSCIFAFTRMGNGKQEGGIEADGLEISGMAEREDDGFQESGADGNREMEEEAEAEVEVEVCDSYTLGETSDVSQWILENWGVDSIGKCYFIELISTHGGLELIVKRPGDNVDYALFSVADDALGKYEFDRQASGIYGGTNDEGLDIYRMRSLNINNVSYPPYYAINEIGKIEHVLHYDGTLYDVSYGENGKQENLKCGRMPEEERKKFLNWAKGEPVQFSFLMEDGEADFEYKYKYDPVTNQIEGIHMVSYENDMEAECSFYYLDLGDGSFLDSVVLRNQPEDGENEYTVQINYNRDAWGNVTSVEIDESDGGGS